MIKTSYYTDQDFERYMARSERERKIQFYVWLGCSFVIQPIIYAILLGDNRLSLVSQVFLLVVSIIAFISLMGLWYCYYCIKQNNQSYQEMRKRERAETHALLDEVEEALGRKLNQDV